MRRERRNGAAGILPARRCNLTGCGRDSRGPSNCPTYTPYGIFERHVLGSPHDHRRDPRPRPVDPRPSLSGRGPRTIRAPRAAGRHRDDGLHDGRDRGGLCFRFHGAAGRWRPYGDPCGGAGAGSRRLLAGPAACKRFPLYLRFGQIRRPGGVCQRHRAGRGRPWRGGRIGRAADGTGGGGLSRRAGNRGAGPRGQSHLRVHSRRRAYA